MADGAYVKARKDHRCQFCYRIIFKGTQYWSERITPWDHSENEHYFSLKAHTRCWELWRSGIDSECDHIFPDDTQYWRESLIELRRCTREGIKPWWQLTEAEKRERIRTRNAEWTRKVLEKQS